MGRDRRVLVVGAGAAGSAAAARLAQAPGVEVLVVGDEPRMPYNRTTVNKGLFTSAVDDAGIALPDLDELPVRWLLGRRAVKLDAARRTIRLDDDTDIGADAVLLATGAHPRALPAPVAPSAAERVVALRTADDTHRLRHLLAHGPGHVVIAGAGLIGTETAAPLRAAGHRVTLVDPAPLPLSRHVGDTVAAWVATAHHRAGIDLRRTLVREITGDAATGTVTVALDDGDVVDATAVLVCLGVDPATTWLRDADLPLHYRSRPATLTHTSAAPADAPGVLVDATQRVSGHERLYAAGDLAAPPGPQGTPIRVEHWGAALGQGRTAAASALADLGLTQLAGQHTAGNPIEVPSYSTYVHTTKLTFVGWPHLGVADHAVLGAPGDARFTVALLDHDHRIVAAIGVGGARAANQLRPLIERHAPAADLPPTAPTPAATRA